MIEKKRYLFSKQPYIVFATLSNPQSKSSREEIGTSPFTSGIKNEDESTMDTGHDRFLLYMSEDLELKIYISGHRS